MSSRHLGEASSRGLQDIPWRRLQDVFETNNMFTGKESFSAPNNSKSPSSSGESNMH